MKRISYLLFLAVFISACVGENGDTAPGKIYPPEPQVKSGHRICVIGDSGMGNEHQYRVADALRQEKCDAIHVVGDIIYKYGLVSTKDPQFQSKFYKPYKKLIEEDKIPFYLALGNHDYLSKPAVWLKLAKKYPNKIIFPSFFYAQDYGDVCLVTFDSNRHFKEQYLWLEKMVKPKLQSKCRFSMAFAHHPYFSVGKHGDAKGGTKEFLEKSVVGVFDVFFSGHDHHLSDEGSVKETRLIISGAAAKLRPLKSPQRIYAISEFGYVVLDIERHGEQLTGRYQFMTVPVEGPVQVVHQGEISGQGLR